MGAASFSTSRGSYKGAEHLFVYVCMRVKVWLGNDNIECKDGIVPLAKSSCVSVVGSRSLLDHSRLSVQKRL